MKRSIIALAIAVTATLSACGGNNCNTGLYDADGNCVSQQQNNGGDDDDEDEDDD